MKPGMNSFSIWSGIIMIVVLVCGAGALIFFPGMLSDRLYGTKRIFFIALLLAYSVYRGFRVYSLIRKNRDEV